MLPVKRISNTKPGYIGNVEANAFTKSGGPSAGRNPHRASKKRQASFLYCKFIFIFLIPTYTLFQVAQNTKYPLSKNLHQQTVLRQSYHRSEGPEFNGSRNPQVEKEISNIIEQYQSVVKSVVNKQSGTWARHKGWTRAEDKDGDHRVKKLSTSSKDHPHGSASSVRMLPPPLFSSQRLSLRGLSHSSNSDIKMQEAVEGVLWDDESDIPTYFDRLLRECRKDAMNPKVNNTFIGACFGFLNRLIHEPRCTVRLDSRITCDRSNAHNKPAEKLPLTKNIDSILGSDYFTNDTINVVIIGGGPVGLFLANALTEMLLHSSLWAINSSTKPSIRLVVFENRLKTTEYHKRPYIRDWMTDIKNEHMFGAIDPRVSAVLDVFAEKVTLPINAIETLLLLSNRDRGVKFVYGNFREHERFLKKIPNLLVFDATGHRLDQLDRGQGNWGERHKVPKGEGIDNGRRFSSSSDLSVNIDNANETVFEWESESQEVLEEIEKTYGIGQTELDGLKANGDAHKIALRHSAKSGQLLYPVLENNKPYIINFLKILNLPFSKNMWNEMRSLSKTIDNPNPYKYKPDNFPYQNYDGSDWYREDVMERMYIDDPGFSIEFSFLNLTPEQAIEMQVLLRKYAKDSEIHRVPFDQIPIEEFTRNEVFQTNKIDELLQLVKDGVFDPDNYKNARSPLLGVFQVRPYFYLDPVVPEGFLYGKATLLRIGDTLMTGDPHLSTGLNRHFSIITMLQCHLWNMHDTLPEISPELKKYRLEACKLIE